MKTFFADRICEGSGAAGAVCASEDTQVVMIVANSREATANLTFSIISPFILICTRHPRLRFRPQLIRHRRDRRSSAAVLLLLVVGLRRRFQLHHALLQIRILPGLAPQIPLSRRNRE